VIDAGDVWSRLLAELRRSGWCGVETPAGGEHFGLEAVFPCASEVEKRVIAMRKVGTPIKEIARELKTSESTIDRILRKMGMTKPRKGNRHPA
jgi:DNA invertase Pin-like site-specific DNA recombinase